jgi:hypothetical protein
MKAYVACKSLVKGSIRAELHFAPFPVFIAFGRFSAVPVDAVM